MKCIRVVLTAGFDRALHVVALAELLTRAGHTVEHVLVVSPFDMRRARQLVRQRGMKYLGTAARRVAGIPTQQGDDELDTFLATNDIRERSLRAWCERARVACTTVTNLNAVESIAIVSAAHAVGVVYGGGGILHTAFIDACGGRVLNAHSGPLPSVRGMNACEWSLLLGEKPTVTIHFIERGIDTGPVLDRIALPVEDGDTIEALRARCTVLGIEGLVRNVACIAEAMPERAANAAAHRQCFVMAPVLRELVANELSRGSIARRVAFR